ncbi:uncharacterized protein LOC135094492 isoform X3 [Scylla paramamosain]|uniref:uncharacterized protein LOC135094492 isoform X3 n=1 Tax=Scylla paramamosain TaxID=85552 RepID=UPI003083BFAA
MTWWLTSLFGACLWMLVTGWAALHWGWPPLPATLALSAPCCRRTPLSLLKPTDKDWRIISREEVGLCLVRVIEETAVCSFDAARSECFTLLYLAAQQGYPNMMHWLLSLKVSPDVRNNQGETPLFVTSLAMPSSPLHITRHWGQVRSGELEIVQQLPPHTGLPRPASTI